MKPSPDIRRSPHEHALPQDSVGRLIASWRQVRPDLDIEPIEVMQRLLRVMGHFQASAATVFARHGLSAPDFAVLVTLVRLEQVRVAGASQRLLTNELGLTAGTMSLRINRLESAGLVHREADPDDKRNAFVRLTNRGREIFEQATPDHLANMRRLLAALTGSEQEQLARLLSKLLIEFEGFVWEGDDPAPLGMVLIPAHVAMARAGSAREAITPCLLVERVEANGAAAAAGIRSGDRLVRAGGDSLQSANCLYEALDGAIARGRLRIRLLRRGRRMDVILRLPADIRAKRRGVTHGRLPNFEHIV
jgi:DNA-binding MarR family transcriptional regulator